MFTPQKHCSFGLPATARFTAENNRQKHSLTEKGGKLVEYFVNRLETEVGHTDTVNIGIGQTDGMAGSPDFFHEATLTTENGFALSFLFPIHIRLMASALWTRAAG